MRDVGCQKCVVRKHPGGVMRSVSDDQGKSATSQGFLKRLPSSFDHARCFQTSTALEARHVSLDPEAHAHATLVTHGSARKISSACATFQW